MELNEFWLALPRDERDRVASRFGVTRASLGMRIGKGVISRRMMDVFIEYYLDVDFGFPPIGPKKPRPAKTKKTALQSIPKEFLRSPITYEELGKVAPNLTIAKVLFETIKQKVNFSRRLIAWICPNGVLKVDVTTGASASEFTKDPAGLVGIYARHCSLMEVANDLRIAYERRMKAHRYVWVSV